MPVYDKPVIQLAPRIKIAMGVMTALFSIIILRLWYLQVIEGDFFRDQSENNRIRQVFLVPPRGLILDRSGVVLAKNRPAFQVDLVIEDTPNLQDTLTSLAQVANVDPEELSRAVKSLGRRRPFEPRMLMKDVSRDLIAQIEARRWQLPGVQTSVVPARYYPYGDLAAHVLGYIGEVSAKQLERPGYAGYRMGDVVGQSGIEARWERYLQGQRGILEVIVNATGTKIGQASFERERSGKNIILTLDKDVQAAAERSLGERRGAVVAIDPRNGEIVAMVSSPRFDPNMFVGTIPKTLWLDVVQGADRKLHNRATQGTYPPGSVFKVFMEAAALSEGVMSSSERVSCPGHLQVGNRLFNCHKRSGHGSVGHFEALVQSCDVYFYIAGNRLGVDRIHAYSTMFGLGAITGLNLGDEASGLIPSTAWKMARFKNPDDQRWYPGETPSVAIGQGAVTTTPLQIARSIAAVVNGGTLYRPLLVKRIESHDGTFVDDQFAPEVMGTVEIDPKILAMVRRDMVGVVNDEHGTARRAQLPAHWNIIVAGKTGTSQVVALEHKDKADHFEHHAWFVGYAPADKPELVVATIVENGGSGGLAAAPVVRDVLQEYFLKTRELSLEAPEAIVKKKPTPANSPRVMAEEPTEAQNAN